MGKKAVQGLAVVLIAGVSFFAGLLLDRYWLVARHPSTDRQATGGKEKAEPKPEDRRREAFLKYLDGKTINLQGPKAAEDKADVPHIIRQEQVQAVQFPMTMAKTTGDPWKPEVSLILDTGDARYFVRCVVPYHDVQDTFAFLGFEVIEVAKQ